MAEKLKIHKDMVGKRFGKLTVIDFDGSCREYPQKDYVYRCYMVTCRCDCGTVFQAVSSMVRQGRTQRCPACAAHHSVSISRSPELDLTGKQFYSLVVLGREGEWRGTNATLWRVRCLNCGRESVIDGGHLGKTKSCYCGRERGLKTGHDAVKSYRFDGSLVPSVMPSRAINKNNTTGHKGVSRMKNGTFRAYITLRRVQYHLGCYSKIEDAVRARKDAEEHIHGDFLRWYIQTHPTEWEKYKERHQNQEDLP